MSNEWSAHCTPHIIVSMNIFANDEINANQQPTERIAVHSYKQCNVGQEVQVQKTQWPHCVLTEFIRIGFIFACVAFVIVIVNAFHFEHSVVLIDNYFQFSWNRKTHSCNKWNNILSCGSRHDIRYLWSNQFHSCESYDDIICRHFRFESSLLTQFYVDKGEVSDTTDPRGHEINGFR